MSKKIIVCAVFAVMSSLMVAGPASAAHCTAEGPGHSYFGTDHVQETDHNEGTHKGFSGCNPSENNPSERAPGQTK